MLRSTPIRNAVTPPSPLTRSGSDAILEADILVARATLEEGTQQSQVEAASVDARYTGALVAQIGAKETQVERIEDRLEALIARQAEAMSQVQAQPPGLLAMPSTRNRWQQQIAQQQGTIARLQERLEHVREIRDTMGIHGPKLEELATRKLRRQDPDLAAEYDDWSAAARAHKAIQRDQGRRNRGLGSGLSLSLDRSNER